MFIIFIIYLLFGEIIIRGVEKINQETEKSWRHLDCEEIKLELDEYNRIKKINEIEVKNYRWTKMKKTKRKQIDNEPKELSDKIDVKQ